MADPVLKEHGKLIIAGHALSVAQIILGISILLVFYVIVVKELYTVANIGNFGDESTLESWVSSTATGGLLLSDNKWEDVVRQGGVKWGNTMIGLHA